MKRINNDHNSVEHKGKGLLKFKSKDIKIKMANKIDCTSLSENNCKLHTVTRPILIICKCIGLFPVAGLFSPTPKKLRTSIKSVYSIICLASVTGQLGMGVLAIAYLAAHGINVRVVYKFLTLFGGTVCTFIIQKLAWNWTKLMKEANEIEKCVPNLNQKNVVRYCGAASAVIITCAIADSILSVRFYKRIAEACAVDVSTTAYYYTYTMPSIAMVVPYSTVTFIISEILLYQSVFVANFADLFIIIISIYLTSYFEEFNEIVVVYKDQCPSAWSDLRMHYTKLTRLCKVIDDRISIFVLFSFGSNLSITCVQLFKVLRKDLAHGFTSECDMKKVDEILNSYDRLIFFTFSILFLVVRSITTAMFASKVHSVARGSTMTLYDVPSSSFNSETRRLLDQLHGNTIALSGLNFFYVTRSMILSIVTAIFTYELVMLQFSQ